MKKMILILALTALFTGCGADSANTADSSAGAVQQQAQEDKPAEDQADSEEAADEKQTDNETSADEEQADEEGDDIYSAIADEVSSISENELAEQDFSYLENYYGFAEADVQGFCLLQAADPMKADTLLFINAASPEKAAEMSETIENVKENTAETFASYAPEQSDLINSSIIKTEGSFVYYIVSEKAADIENTVSAYIS